MSKEIAETRSSLQIVTRADIDALRQQRELMKEFISSQLREANFKDSSAESYGEGDYGIVPGTKKKSLLKPGAEKLNQLYRYGGRFITVKDEVDRHQNVADFVYKCQIFDLRTGNTIAECEGSASSQEVKYRERSVWRNKTAANGKNVREQVKEETPISDILNTLRKMAQKRAYIGATIMATGASDFFTQDMEFDEDPSLAKQEKTSEPSNERDVSEAPSGEPPVCCGKTMMLSKYPNKTTGDFDWYCVHCKTSKPKGA